MLIKRTRQVRKKQQHFFSEYLVLAHLTMFPLSFHHCPHQSTPRVPDSLYMCLMLPHPIQHVS